MKVKVISGGQTGADQGALVAAKQLGLETGGWMPRGFLTEAGPCPDFAGLYGVQEHPSPLYPPRTKQNVADADLTVWVGPENDSRGFQCTRKAVIQLQKPFLINPSPETLREAITTWHVRVLNVAGPRASRVRGAHSAAAELVRATLGGTSNDS